MSRNAWIVFVVLCVGLLGGLVWLSQNNRTDVSDVNASVFQPASEENGNIADHTLGNPEAKVTIVEYADFQCPGCASAAPVMKELANKYDQEVFFILRNYPLSAGHANARAAAAAAEAAGLQDKYWQMHDILFANQNEWKDLSPAGRTDTFTRYAREIDLDLAKFTEDIESSRVSEKINYDLALGRKVNVQGTPAIYVNDDLADSYTKDGAIVSQTTEGSQPIWSDSEAFEKLVLLPALKEAGVDVEE